MTPGIRPLVAGNWKMNGTGASLNELRAIGHGFMSGLDAETDALICPPATLLTRAVEVLSTTPVKVGGQDCHAKESGAHTGDISAEMLKDAGASHVIVGHSERRTDHGETDAIVRAKAEAAWRAGIVAIICIGETRAERELGSTLDILSRQIAGSVPPTATAHNTDHRLRAGLGDRHRPYPDRRRRRRGACAYPRRTQAAAQRGIGEDAHPLRRLGQAVERRRAACRSRMSTARWSAAPASSLPISSASQKPTARSERHNRLARCCRR